MLNERTRIALLLGLTIFVYANTLVNDFAFDDELYILRNPVVTSPSTRGFLLPARDNVFRPLTFATFALNWAAAGPRPFGYHLFNLLLHAAVSVLVYLLLRTILEPVSHDSSIAFAAALLFAVHPIHTEAVSSIVGRSELLAAGFLLVAWLLHLRDRQVASLVCLLLAMMAKESAVVFLPLVLTADLACGKLKPLRRYAVISGVIALYVALIWTLKGGRFGQVTVTFLNNPLATLPADLRILNALRIAWKYVGLQMYPATLSYDYSYNGILLYSSWRHTAPAAAATLLVLAAWVWALWTRRTAWALAGGIYLGAFAVTSNIFFVTGTIMGERLAYLPSAGFCLAIALLWMRLEIRKTQLGWVVPTIVVAGLGLCTIVRNRDWMDNEHLFLADVRAVPGSAKVRCNAGVVYMTRGQLEAARTEFLTALRIFPDSPESLEGYGSTEALMGEDQEGLRLLQKALSLTSKNEMNYDFRAVTLAAQLMKVGKDDEALQLLDTEIQESRGDTRAWSNRAIIRQRRGELELARTDAQMALRLDPTNVQAENLLSTLKARAGNAR
jgi:tetratricopeptide (TPR) repeat protein